MAANNWGLCTLIIEIPPLVLTGNSLANCQYHVDVHALPQVMDIYSSPPSPKYDHQIPCTYMMYLVNNLGTTMDTKNYCPDTAVPVTFNTRGIPKQDANVHVAFLQQESEAHGRFWLKIEG